MRYYIILTLLLSSWAFADNSNTNCINDQGFSSCITQDNNTNVTTTTQCVTDHGYTECQTQDSNNGE